VADTTGVAERHLRLVRGELDRARRGGRGCSPFTEEEAEIVRRLVPALALGEAALTCARFAPDTGERISRREREIIGYVGAGLTNREIARLCGISAHTVHRHLANLYAKLGVGSRAELVRCCLVK
jgi:DNA-binding CsgD family transcriptional regulator